MKSLKLNCYVKKPNAHFDHTRNIIKNAKRGNYEFLKELKKVLEKMKLKCTLKKF